MFQIDIKKKFNLSKIKLDLHKELNYSADIIVKDHFERLNVGKSYKGGSMEPLKPATIKAKGGSQILVNEDKMRHLNRKNATKSRQVAEVFPGTKRERKGKTNQQIGSYHQEGGGNLPKREWFGISKDSEKKSLKVIEHAIDKALRKL